MLPPCSKISRGCQQAILGYVRMRFPDFSLISPWFPSKMTSYIIKWLGLEGWADFRAWFQGNLLWFLMISTWFELISPRGVRDFFRCRPLAKYSHFPYALGWYWNPSLGTRPTAKGLVPRLLKSLVFNTALRNSNPKNFYPLTIVTSGPNRSWLLLQ